MIQAKYSANLDFLEDLQKELKSVKGVKAGYFKGQIHSNSNGLTVEQIALIQIYGNDKIPPRDFLAKAMRDIDKWTPFIKQWQDEGLSFELICERLGNLMRESIIKSINNGGWTPNSAYTIAKKGSSTPLVNTGEMRNATSYEVLK